MTESCPARLVVVRHGESLGNVADLDAHRRGLGRLELTDRDADVELSDTGRHQAAALGSWLAEAGTRRPDVVLSSPFRRALSTAQAALAELPPDERDRLRPRLDERLRERDLGAFDGLTRTGVRELFPDEAERSHRVGKFYFRPPGGESWCDVVLRVRSLLRDVAGRYPGQDVWLFSHRAVAMSVRVVVEELDERTALRIDREEPMANCSITTFVERGGRLVLESYADTSVIDAAAPVTEEPESAGRGEQSEASHG